MDPLTLVFLLLPVAAASGWWLAKRGANAHDLDNSQSVGREYIRGLDFLINEETDKALEVFTRLVEVDQDTIEMHLSLGALFRRRGEVDRALRVHQNLIARPQLPKALEHRALLELGRDYLAAGVLDRAEEKYRELVARNAYLTESLKSLIRIYEQEREWEEAIEVNRRLDAVSSQYRGQRLHVIANYHCELAQSREQKGDLKGAKASFRKAIYVYPQCARANLALGDMAANAGDSKEAIKHWIRVPEQVPALLPEVLPRLKKAQTDLNQLPHFIHWCKELTQQYQGVGPYIYLSQLYYDVGEQEKAEYWLKQYLDNSPQLPGMASFYSLVVSEWSHEPVEQVRQWLRAALRQSLNNIAAYRCNQCGFEVRQLHWHCPSCHQWDTIVPLAHGPAGLPSNDA